jgi:hypothetical protein
MAVTILLDCEILYIDIFKYFYKFCMEMFIDNFHVQGACSGSGHYAYIALCCIVGGYHVTLTLFNGKLKESILFEMNKGTNVRNGIFVLTFHLWDIHWVSGRGNKNWIIGKSLCVLHLS